MATAPASRADDSDKWLGADKGLHFAASAAIAGATYGVSAPHFESRHAPLLVGAGVGILAGVSKEGWDASGNGTFSWKDLAWDALGVATGLVIAWSVDVLLRGSSHRKHSDPVTP
jgi:putative lipoprotein